jgi:superfamily II DNA/RNA helicase
LSFSNELNLHSHYQHPSTNGIRALILCPTRELATQTTRESKKLAKGKKFRIKLMTRELLRSADLSKLPCDILISTPLRLRFAIRKKKLDLSRYVVLISYLCNLIHAGRKTKPINRMMVWLKKNLWLNQPNM